MPILIFKTNIICKNDYNKIASILNTTKDILTWSIDIEDIDKVLRIESIQNNTQDIIITINQAGFICEELPD